MCYKLPPSNAQDPAILNTYRQRYDFVLKMQTSTSSNSGRTSMLVQLSTNCPTKLAINDDPNRFPRMIPYVKCDNCDKVFCKPVKFSHKVLYSKCDYKTGEMVWKWKDVVLNVAFVYTKKLAWIISVSWTCNTNRFPIQYSKHIWKFR